jgi:ribose/xylose/arabinose/galactoside ABC-type transport system permease subunit
MMSFIGIVVAMIITKTGSIPLAAVTGLLMGLVLGTINGIIVAKSKAASFIITLGLLLAYRGAAVVVSSGFNFPLHGKFNWIGQGKLGGVFPVPILIFILIFILAYVILRFTKFGRMLYIIGGNEKAAFVSGINVDRYKIMTYGFSGLLVGLATLILLSRLGSAYPNTGERYALDSLAAVVVGGASLYGGKGSALGLMLGVLVFGLITNSLNLVNINPYWRDTVVGIVIIVAVIVGQLGSRRQV